MTNETNLFDTDNAADLPEGYATKSRAHKTGQRSETLANLIIEHGSAVTVSQARAAYFRSTGDDIPVTSVRVALNAAVAEGYLVKVTRQTYGPTLAA